MEDAPLLQTPEDFSWGDAVICPEPDTSGWARLVDEGMARGLDSPLPAPPGGDLMSGMAAVAAQDLDADGDIDILIGQPGRPKCYLNDGAAFFDPCPEFDESPIHLMSVLVSAVDVDGDQLPDVFAQGEGIAWWPALGDGLFDTPRAVEVSVQGHPAAICHGDVDLDGDLDLFYGTVNTDPFGDRLANELLLWQDGDLVAQGPLGPSGGTGLNTQVGLFTDRDLDGDPDLLVGDASPSDGGQATAFYRNDTEPGGPLELVDDAPEVLADLSMISMGLDAMDLNEDGLLDYCITDIGPTRCLFSSPDGYVETTHQVGLFPEEPPYPIPSVAIAWSLDFADLDNDGYPDAAQSGGPDHRVADYPLWPDQLFFGLPGGSFEEVSAEAEFDDLDPHYGLATADFDGDGFLDVVVVGPGQPPKLMMNRCDASGWVEFELVGPPENSEGFGAIAVLTDSRRTWTRELYNVRGTGQSVSRFHFGLGTDPEVELLRLTWPDGHVSQLEGLPINRIIAVRHPRSEL